MWQSGCVAGDYTAYAPNHCPALPLHTQLGRCREDTHIPPVKWVERSASLTCFRSVNNGVQSIPGLTLLKAWSSSKQHMQSTADAWRCVHGACPLVQSPHPKEARTLHGDGRRSFCWLCSGQSVAEPGCNFHRSRWPREGQPPFVCNPAPSSTVSSRYSSTDAHTWSVLCPWSSDGRTQHCMSQEGTTIKAQIGIKQTDASLPSKEWQ